MESNMNVSSNNKIETLLEHKECQYVGISFFVVAIIFLILSIIMKNCGMLCSGVGMMLIAINRSADSITKLFAAILLLVMNYVLYIKLNSFEFFPQAYDLLKTDPSLYNWFMEGHVHAIRLLIAYPGYILQQLFEIELNEAFGYYCTIIFMLIFINIMNIKTTFFSYKKTDVVNSFMAFTFTVFMFFIMNGRISFAFLGFSILIYQMILLYREKKPGHWISRYFKIVMAMVLSTVSSGTMMVCCGFICIMFIMRIIRSKRIEKSAIRLITICMLGLPIIFYAVKYVVQMINKNITFFGGGIQGIINMMQHGLGSIFGAPTSVDIILILCMGCIALMLNIVFLKHMYKKYDEKFPLIIAVNISFYGSFFGLSTGTLILVPIVILLLLLFDILHNKGKEARLI